MIDFLKSENFISSFSAVIIAFVIYLITRFITYSYGLNIKSIGKTIARIEKTEHLIALFSSLVSKEGVNKNKIRKIFISVRLKLNDASSSLETLLYEGEDDPNITCAVNTLDSIIKSCDNVALYYNTDKVALLSKELKKMEKKLKDTESILKEVKKERDDERKKVI